MQRLFEKKTIVTNYRKKCTWILVSSLYLIFARVGSATNNFISNICWIFCLNHPLSPTTPSRCCEVACSQWKHQASLSTQPFCPRAAGLGADRPNLRQTRESAAVLFCCSCRVDIIEDVKHAARPFHLDRQFGLLCPT